MPNGNPDKNNCPLKRGLNSIRIKHPATLFIFIITTNLSRAPKFLYITLTSLSPRYKLNTMSRYPFEMRWIWLGLVILFALIEVLTFNLTTIWFALSALIMVFLSLLPIPVAAQILIFLGFSAVFLFLTRPLVLKKFKIGRVKTNVDSMIGKHALVTRPIREFESGEVKVGGQYWTARTEDGAEIAKGIKCEIMRIEGVHAIVRKLAEPQPDNAN